MKHQVAWGASRVRQRQGSEVYLVFLGRSDTSTGGEAPHEHSRASTDRWSVGANDWHAGGDASDICAGDGEWMGKGVGKVLDGVQFVCAQCDGV